MNFELNKLKFSIYLDARDVGRNASKWKEISREAALGLQDTSLVVVHYFNCGMHHARWFDSSSQFLSARGPYDYSSLRYYQFIGNLPTKVTPATGGGSGPKRPDSVHEEEAGALEVKSPSKEKISLFDAIWIGESNSQDKSKKPIAITSAMLMASISCKVSSEGLMPGDSITFNIMRADTSEKIETVMGRMESNPDGDIAVAKWQVRGKAIEDALSKGSVELYFVAKHFAKKLECKSGKLVVSDGGTINHHMDIHEESAKNDLVILETTDGSWKHTLGVKDMKELSPNWVEMVFPGAPKGKVFNLIKDPKDGVDPYYLFQDVGYDELIKEEHFEDV